MERGRGYNGERGGTGCRHIAAVEARIMRQKDPPASPVLAVLGRAQIRCPGKCKSGPIIRCGLRRHPRLEPARSHRRLGREKRFSNKPRFGNKALPPNLAVTSVMLAPLALRRKQSRCCPATADGECTWTPRSRQRADPVHTLTASKPSFGSKRSADEKFKRIGGKDRWLFAVTGAAARFALSRDVAASKM